MIIILFGSQSVDHFPVVLKLIQLLERDQLSLLLGQLFGQDTIFLYNYRSFYLFRFLFDFFIFFFNASSVRRGRLLFFVLLFCNTVVDVLQL